ncbi:M23 family metallopeptidase [Streptomyces sp. ISL-100]|uniref:M23 family metallopeptidase n=1 Tax=Streptomyces sp. ISL-100 TaxID=2819173 RepID=UPI001BE5412A|nr:M23 family metallopeptidase [Streptomyces sp. ISL-100]MBT2396093.1 M23 family metallopeptidase [Streptomyces sp. ISL-100]
MDDQHAHAGYDGYSTGTFHADPLFGTLPAQGSHYEAGHSGQYDTTQCDATSAQQTAGYDAYGTQQHQQQQQYDATGAWPTAAYQTAAEIPAQSTGQWDSNPWNQTGQFDTSHLTTGQYDTGQYGTGHLNTGHLDTSHVDTSQYDNGPYETGQYETAQFTQAADATGQWNTTPGYDNGASDTGAYDATAWNTGAYETAPPQQQVFYETAEFPVADLADLVDDTPEAEHEYAPDHAPEQEHEPEPEPDPELEHAPAAATAASATAPGSRSARRSAGNSGRGRRRTPAKRSALLTVAVPSACVMGVAGIAAASVGSAGGGTPAEEKKDTTRTVTAADPGSVKPVAVNNKLDTQLAALDEDVNDFADRASRTQERIDLQARQATEKKRRAEEAARKEAARPKFALPVEQHGLSAYYGQAGINWMSVHSGIDFPVSYGTPVMAATDGTVRTQYNSAYGNMAIVTAPDGTETWYCHLSSTKIRSGSVQAGDTIAYSGNSGNSTGPHLHFEVRPGGGSAIDPLPWLRSHGLSPT